MDSALPRPPLGSGDLFMGRYRLDAELFSNLPGAWRFRATDKILARQIDVYLLTGPRTEDAIDAARRAALLDDPRVARIIDAGSYSGTSFVLTEALEGVSLADVGPLHAAQARAVAGEVASALAAAARVDVHHLSLSPELVFLGQGNSVKVSGMAWDAALRGIADLDPVASDAVDAKALISVLYAALTARWPGQAPSVMPLPPLWDGNPVAPIELVSAVPGDLNTLCAVALEGGGGPQSAAQVVSHLGVWPPVNITLRHSVSVRGPVSHALTSPEPETETEDQGRASEPETPLDSETGLPSAGNPSSPVEPVAPPVPLKRSSLARGVAATGPSDADVAALAEDAEIQDKLAAIEAILAPLGYDLTPSQRKTEAVREARRRIPPVPSAQVEAAVPASPAPVAPSATPVSRSSWRPTAPAEPAETNPTTEPIPTTEQTELLERMQHLASIDLPAMPEVPELDLPPLPEDLAGFLASPAGLGIGSSPEAALPTPAEPSAESASNQEKQPEVETEGEAASVEESPPTRSGSLDPSDPDSTLVLEPLDSAGANSEDSPAGSNLAPSRPPTRPTPPAAGTADSTAPSPSLPAPIEPERPQKAAQPESTEPAPSEDVPVEEVPTPAEPEDHEEIFDTTAPAFENVFEDLPVEPKRTAEPRGWLSVVVFAVIVAVCVLVGIVILNKAGILSLDLGYSVHQTLALESNFPHWE